MDFKKFNLIIDVDGVMTTGQFLYSSEGKAYKIFGPHDAEGLKIIKDKLNILFISADKRGFSISEKRITDMGYSIELVPEEDRYRYIKENWGFENTFFMGDGLSDVNIIKDCLFGIVPANARIEAKKVADFVTPSKSAEGAVCDACIEINKRFFSNEEYKVCILAAGVGSRMEDFCKTFNKALIPIKGKPAICYIIEKFSKDTEIVIALGYKKETITDYLAIAYPHRKFTFVEVDNYLGPGSGPGYSLLQCKKYLQCPFIFISVDTLIREEVPKPDKNWFGIAEVSDISRFCSVKLNEQNQIIKMDDKIKTDNKFAFIGLAGIKDYEVFWRALEENKNIISGEIQVSNGFMSLIGKDFIGKIFTWFDTGTPISYKYALENYPYGRGYKGEQYG